MLQECITRESKGGEMERGGHVCVVEKKEQRKLRWLLGKPVVCFLCEGDLDIWQRINEVFIKIFKKIGAQPTEDILTARCGIQLIGSCG